MESKPLTPQEKKKGAGFLILLIGLSIIEIMILFSCSTYENLTEHNNKDYLIIDYEYPWAEVEVVYDTLKVIEFRFMTDTSIKVGSYGIYKYNKWGGLRLLE